MYAHSTFFDILMDFCPILNLEGCNDELIKTLKTLYPSIIFIDKNPIETIQFGSTCKNIILSHGSFSAVIGVH